MNKTNEKLEKARELFEMKLKLLNSKDFVNQLESLQTPEDKRKFAEENNLSINELNDVLNNFNEWKHWDSIRQNTWNAAFNSRSGIDFSTDIQKTGEEAAKKRKIYAYSLKQSAISRMTYDLTKDEITPEFLEVMQENGYEGKTGSDEFKKIFQEHLQVKTNEKIAMEKQSQIDSASYSVNSLKGQFDNLSNDIRETDTFMTELSHDLGISYSSHAPKYQINSIVHSLSQIDKGIHENDLEQEMLNSIGSRISPTKTRVKDISDLYYQESFDNVKKNLYMKVQSVLQNGKLEKYAREKEQIQNEKVGFLGRFNGRQALKDAKLKNIDLKIKIANQQLPEPQPGQYGVHETLISMYECSISELDGQISPQMQEMINRITYNIDESGRPFNLNALYQEAQRRVSFRQQNNLPAVQKNSFFQRKQNMLALKGIENQNEGLANQLSYLNDYNREQNNHNYFSKRDYNNTYNDRNRKPTALELLHYNFEEPIRGVEKEVSLRGKNPEIINKDNAGPELY